VECYHTAEMHCAFLTEHGEDVAVSAERDQLVEFLQSGYDSGGMHDEDLVEAEDVQNDLDLDHSQHDLRRTQEPATTPTHPTDQRSRLHRTTYYVPIF
jgi:hypothetical protein